MTGKRMKVVILAGGFGTRLSELTDNVPKPMVTIGDRPLLWHLMNSFACQGFSDFVVALGYKASVVKEYFLNYSYVNSDFQIDLQTGTVKLHDSHRDDWRVSLIDTGLLSMTGGRLKRLRKYLGKETFIATYGDGLADVNIKELVKFHKSHGKMATLTSVRPSARFGEVTIENSQVKSFKEKPQTQSGWINGGYFVFEPEFLDLIEDEQTVLEAKPLETAASSGQLMAFQHSGFWQCMDTLRDKRFLEERYASGQIPWILNNND
jgi:glucose-1-phosphate cytidylyltransferase